MSGQETFAALREIDPGVKVLISSGYSESEAMRTFSGQKPAGFVQKPYTAHAPCVDGQESSGPRLTPGSAKPRKQYRSRVSTETPISFR